MAFPTGVRFPEVSGRRSATATGQAVLADALAAADPAAAQRARAQQDWRHGYLPHVVALTAAGARSRAAALAVARAGLASAHERFVFGSDAGEQPVLAALAGGSGDELGTATVVGRGEPVRQVTVPYRGSALSGDALRRQLDDWVARGIVEPSCAAAVGQVVANPDWLDLSDRAVAVLGAGSEMGPLPALLGYGATVLAVDVPSPAVWGRVLDVARSGAGTVHVPETAPGDGDLAARAGADLLAGTPALARWLERTAPGLPLTIGSYAYADGAAHLQLALAADALVAHLLRVRPGTSYAELATPTDSFVVPPEVVRGARARWSERGWRARAQRPLQAVSRGRLYTPSYRRTVRGEDGRELGIADVLVPVQGPSYALAKRLQRWRATVTRADEVLVSANVAPSTRTRSVLRSRVLAAAYSGAARFGIEIFEPATSRALMAALLVHDLRSPTAAGRPGTPLAHPDDLFAQGAAHGGLWRLPYDARSVLPVAALAGARHLLG